jgi:tetratricopeptide (TPR) repeat protein
LIEDVTQLIAKHRSWGIAYVVRSRLRSDLAMETRRLEDIEHAIADANIAQRLIPDNPFILTVYLIAWNRGIELKESLNQDATAWRLAAEALATQLSKWPKFVLGREECCRVYHREGKLDLERQEELALIKQEAGGVSTRLAWLIETNDQRQLAAEQQALADDPNAGTQLMRAMALACSQAGTSEAMRCFEKLSASDTSYTHLSIALDIPLLCGRVDVAQRASRVLLDRELPPTLWIWWQYRAQYLADRETEEQLLARAGPFSDTACVAHYTIGLRALAEGHRAKAEQHLRMVTQASNPTWWCSRWAAAFLSCLERDPTWPRWIPAASPK